METIESVADYLIHLKGLKYTPGQLPWYRGHADKSWNLLPAYHRLKNPAPESVLINRFRQNANLLIAQRPESNFEWLFLMQHYGVPTRLLDWTESPLIALYFSVVGEPKKDGAIWALDPVKLNQSTKARPQDYKFVPSFDDERVRDYDTLSVEAKPELGMEPMAVMATRNNARIQAQLGVFTISHFAKKSVSDIAGGDHLTEFEVPWKRKKEILKELELLAYGKFQVFPELSSIGDIIRGGLR
ncbi:MULTISPECIES: FRG domain-containing protein [unclassified Stenotrophomonas]|uniref:FRG domain-containing protein n=1 Tax=unclassified Stenotrophomonas TaxID=196198 RepID=UPI00346550E9